MTLTVRQAAMNAALKDGYHHDWRERAAAFEAYLSGPQSEAPDPVKQAYAIFQRTADVAALFDLMEQEFALKDWKRSGVPLPHPDERCMVTGVKVGDAMPWLRPDSGPIG